VAGYSWRGEAEALADLFSGRSGLMVRITDQMEVLEFNLHLAHFIILRWYAESEKFLLLYPRVRTGEGVNDSIEVHPVWQSANPKRCRMCASVYFSKLEY
jgi:hypothetical protein